MSQNTILGWFCKSGPLHHLSRRFHALSRTAKEKALELIASGTEPDKAIRQARRAQ